MNYNKAIIAGRIANDIELRTTTSGLSVMTLRVAVNDFKKNQDGQKEEEANFFSCVLFGRLAELVNQYMQKGQIIMVDGKLKNSSWQDKEGNTKYKTEILVDNMQMGAKPGGATAPVGNASQNREDPMEYFNKLKNKATSKQDLPPKEKENSNDVKLEDIPF